MGGTSMTDTAGAWYVTDETTLAHCQVGDAEGIVKKLQEMFDAREPRALIRFESLLRGIMEIHGYIMKIGDTAGA